MALLRISRPGKEPDHIDLGPSTGRTTHTRGMVRGGAIVEVKATTWKQARKDDAAARQESKR
jgi:hypothetical protein